MVIPSRWRALVILLSCLVGACNSGGDATSVITGTILSNDGSAVSGTAETQPSIEGVGPVLILQGNWATDCVLDDDQSGLIYSRQTLSVSDADVTKEFATYSDRDCTLPQVVGVVVSGSTVQAIGVSVPTNEVVDTTLGQAVAVDFHFDVPTVDNSPLPDEFIGLEGFNTKVVHDIVLVHEGKLYFGDTNLPGFAGRTPQTRPVSLLLGVSYNKIP